MHPIHIAYLKILFAISNVKAPPTQKSDNINTLFHCTYIVTFHSIASVLTFVLTFSSRHTKSLSFTRFLTGDERIELPLRVLETPVIPFDQSPILNSVQDAKKHPFRCIPVPSKPHISPHSILLSYPPLCFPLQGRSTHYARKNLAKFLEQASY